MIIENFKTARLWPVLVAVLLGLPTIWSSLRFVDKFWQTLISDHLWHGLTSFDVCLGLCSMLALSWAGGLFMLSVLPLDYRFPARGAWRWRLPPGPSGIPIFGNLLTFMRGMRADPKGLLLKLAWDHGEMTTLHLGSKTWILLNSHRVCHEIIVKLGSITTERQHLPVASGLLSRGRRTLVQPQDEWTENRRAMHQLFTGAALREHAKIQQIRCSEMMLNYLKCYDDWSLIHHRYAMGGLVNIVLGNDFAASPEDIGEIDRTVNEFTDAMLWIWVDWFPALEHLPHWMQIWRPHWIKMGDYHNEVYHKWYDPALQAIQAGTARPSWLRDVLLNSDFGYKGDADDAMYTAMQMIEGGTSTLTGSLNTFVMAMALYHRELARLRQEVDRVCGDDDKLRSPTIADLDRLPYTAATLKEVMRWRPLFLSPEHTLSKDLDFEGYHIPAGVSFVINGAAVTRDIACPELFEPSRWLTGTEHNIIAGLWQFGGGRRMCPAYKFAQQGLMLCFARLAQSFDYQFVEGGFEEYKNNAAARDADFPVRVRLRSDRHAQLIRQDAIDAGFQVW